METLDSRNLVQRSPQQYFKDALQLIKTQQTSLALQALDAAIVFSHNSPFYIYQKIRLLYQLDAWKTCSQLIVSQLEYLYRHSSLYLFCRNLDYLQKMNQYDLDDLSKLLKQSRIPYCLATSYKTLLTEKDKPFLKLARKAMVQDNYPLCLCYCDLYLKLHPACSEIYYMQAYSYHMLGDLISAKNNYLKFLQINSDSAEAYIHVALVSMELREYEVAIQYFHKALSLEPDNLNYRLYLGECYYAAKKLNCAVITYKEIIKHAPTNLQNYFNLTHTYKKMSKHIRSMRYSRLIKKHLKNRI